MWWRQTKSYCKNIIRHFINKWSIDIKLFKAHADEKVNKNADENIYFWDSSNGDENLIEN